MIPRDYITEWRSEAPWVEDYQVEQDLVISKALIDIFSHPLLGRTLAFRGGTALYKLFISPPARYSEDIDLVLIETAAAGPIMDALHEVLDPWLGRPRYKQTEGRVTFDYRFTSEDPTRSGSSSRSRSTHASTLRSTGLRRFRSAYLPGGSKDPARY